MEACTDIQVGRYRGINTNKDMEEYSSTVTAREACMNRVN
jgi:hypothetical protein